MKIDPLAKVTLSVAFQPEGPETATETTTKPVTFIFGIGLSGLTDFECVLTARADENEIRLCLKPDDNPLFFGHLAPLFEPCMKTGGEIHLCIMLLSAEPASSREVVKAMASSMHCGCGCDCGCH